MKVLYVNADTNDGDYISKETETNEEDHLRLLKIVEKLLRNPISRIEWFNHKATIRWETCDIGNSVEDYVTEGILTQEEAEFFDEYLPYGEHGIHTVETIELREVEVLQRIV